MTFITKVRGAGGLIVAEYRCPLHGVFEATVQRNESGDAPDWQCCEALDEWEEVCNEPSPWTISAPKQRVVSVTPTAAIRGGDMKDRPAHMLDTRPLAEGMPLSQWKAKQREITRANRHKMLVDKGVISKKVMV